jgi:hypothetical protein
MRRERAAARVCWWKGEATSGPPDIASVLGAACLLLARATQVTAWIERNIAASSRPSAVLAALGIRASGHPLIVMMKPIQYRNRDHISSRVRGL